MNILLDYAFPISSIVPTPAASTGFLKQVCLVCKPNGGGTAGNITECVSMDAVGAVTDNDEAEELFKNMNKVFILQAADLDLGDFLEGHESDFFTLLISSDFTDEELAGDGPSDAVKASKKIQDITYTADDAGEDGNEITISYIAGGTKGSEVVTVLDGAIEVQIEHNVSTAQDVFDAIDAESDATDLVDLVIDDGDEGDVQATTGGPIALENGAEATTDTAVTIGGFKGVVGMYSSDQEAAASYAAIENHCGFFSSSTTKAKNMCFAFGSMLSNALNWVNQQYITMPYADDTDTLGESETNFDDKVSFVISDDEFGEKLALFACGHKAIVGPYIKRNLEIDMQSEGLQFLSGSQPTYTKKNATLLENALQDVVNSYVLRGWIENGTVAVLLEQDNFVASAYINIAEPKALWRVFGEMRQTL